jgi:hypothetical protein
MSMNVLERAGDWHHPPSASDRAVINLVMVEVLIA